jgi:uncharacterized protein involved in tolerance to divalent cations
VAEKIGRTIVEERLAACVNIIPDMRSIYRWQGNVEAAISAQAQNYSVSAACGRDYEPSVIRSTALLIPLWP